jgi:predicted ABC-type ATPase
MFTGTQTNILQILTEDASRELSMSQLGRLLGKMPGVFQRGLNSLEDRGYITSRRAGNRRMIRINLSHPHAPEIAGIIEKPVPLPLGDFYLKYPRTRSGVTGPPGVYETSELKILILAGPNGAGKTTFAREFLTCEAGCPVFINADYIAHGLSPFSPEDAAAKAARLMINELESYISQRRSVAFETTLSGRRYMRLIPQWREYGYRVKLIFLFLASAEVAVARVANRVAQGGHDIPEHVIRRRYEMGRRNFEETYKPLVDSWALYDNSGTAPLLIDEAEAQL